MSGLGRRTRWTTSGVAALLCWAHAGVALAGGGAATDAYEDIREHAALDVHGLADVYAQHDFDRPPSGTAQLRAFDGATDRPSLNFARVTLAHRPEVLGFRVDAGVGDTPNGFLRSDPAAAAHPGLSRALSYVEQAFVTARVGSGLAIDVGKFGTPVGLEDNETPQNWNYSRSLLYTWAEPTVHTGVRLTYPVADALALSAFWMNGWNANLAEGNGMRSFAAAASWRPDDALVLALTYMGGLERTPMRLADPTLALRHEVDVFATYALTRAVSFAFTADYGRDAALGGASWWGLGGYVRARVLRWLAGTVRGEHFADPDGFTTGTAQRVAELTATIEARGTAGPATFIVRLEYRRDRSDARVFETRAPQITSPITNRLTSQDTLGLALITLF